MGRRIPVPVVNAGSMADIAFLLLIFFLVTTTIETEAGIDRKLPPVQKEPIVIEHKEKNILSVLLDGAGRLMVEGDLTEIKDLRTITKAFVDNGGASEHDDGYCGHCKGLGDATSSDNPSKAIVLVKTQRETEYGMYVAVQNELVGAYNELRNREGQRLYQQDYTDMERQYQDPKTLSATKVELKKRIQHLRELYPLNILEPSQQ